jgi:hypothetical protein
MKCGASARPTAEELAARRNTWQLTTISNDCEKMCSLRQVLGVSARNELLKTMPDEGRRKNNVVGRLSVIKRMRLHDITTN